MTSRLFCVLITVAAGLLVLIGVVVFVSTPTESFGWFAYQPRSDDDGAFIMDGAVLLSRQQAIAATAIGLGLALATGVLGFRLGQRAAGLNRRP